MVVALVLGLAGEGEAEANAEGVRYFRADTRVYGSCRVYTFTDKMGLEAPSVQMKCGDRDLNVGLVWNENEGRPSTMLTAPSRVPKISECSKHGECVVPVRFSHWSTARYWISDVQVATSDIEWIYGFFDVDFVEHARKADYLHVAFGVQMLRIPLDGFTAAYADFSVRLGQ